jgi:hypothetical protein
MADDGRLQRDDWMAGADGVDDFLQFALPINGWNGMTIVLVASATVEARSLIQPQFVIPGGTSIAPTNTSEPLFYKITALWGGQPGSLMFFAWVMSTFSAAAILLNWRSERRLMPWVVTFTMATLGFFIVLVVFYENPFARLWLLPDSVQPIKAVFAPSGATLFQPSDGQGLNPLLRHFEQWLGRSALAEVKDARRNVLAAVVN